MDETFTAPSNLESSLLISATYNGPRKKVVLKFYEPKEQKIWFGGQCHVVTVA